jgi:hypothetical protein
LELAPEGNGYRSKTRFAKFYNLPELMTIFKQVADIKTADVLDLPLPKANFQTIAVEASDIQKEMIKALAERAKLIADRRVAPDVDNMLKITTDGRKIGLDQRLINPLLPDEPGSKVNACANQVYQIWEESRQNRSTQAIFCDYSTPGYKGKFNLYDDIKDKLIERGVPEDEIAFIHDAPDERAKRDLFAKVRLGNVRVIIGSTAKMGAGTNIQDRLIAAHDLDCPWRPADLAQRAGRIIRQGNQNPEVAVYRYVTAGTFDAYLFQGVEKKQAFISQIMTSKTPERQTQDMDETVLDYAEIKALCAGDPTIKERMELEVDVQQLRRLKNDHQAQIYSLQDRLRAYFPQQIRARQAELVSLTQDIEHAEQNRFLPDEFNAIIKEQSYRERSKAGEALLVACQNQASIKPVEIGEYRGFKLEAAFNPLDQKFMVSLKGAGRYQVTLGDSPSGNITRVNNLLENLSETKQRKEQALTDLLTQQKTAEEQAQNPFPREQEYQEKNKRLNELDIQLRLDAQLGHEAEVSPEMGEAEQLDHAESEEQQAVPLATEESSQEKEEQEEMEHEYSLSRGR